MPMNENAPLRVPNNGLVGASSTAVTAMLGLLPVDEEEMERVEVVTVVEARKVAAVEALVAAAKEAAVEVVATKGVVGAAVAGMVERAEVETMAAGADAAGGRGWVERWTR